MADFLNKTFRAFDRAAFAGMHALHNAAGGFFNGLCKAVSFLADGGWCYIAAALSLILFCRTRKIGLSMGIALVIGALLTNIILKNAVQRPRPYTQSAEFHDWWVAAGSNIENSYSFPSGHATASFAAMVAFFASGKKKYSWAGLPFAALVAFSRVYLIVHYATDVLAGFIIGSIAGVCGALLCKLVYAKAGGKFKTVLYEVDAVTIANARKNKRSASTLPPDPPKVDEIFEGVETDSAATESANDAPAENANEEGEETNEGTL